MRPPVDVGVHRAPRCEPVVSLVRSRRAPPVPLIVLPKSCSCRWGPCPRPIPRLACLFSFFLSFDTGETAKRDTKRQTPQGGRRLAHHTPLLKIPVWWRRAVLPSLPWVVCFLSFFLCLRLLLTSKSSSKKKSVNIVGFFISFFLARDWRALALTQVHHELN